MAKDVNEVRPNEALDWDKLEAYLRTEIPELEGELSVGQFHGGHANLTYWLQFGTTELVLRRPPFGKIAPGAHDMEREFNVLSKLYQHFPLAPRAYHLCLDESIIGAKFVVMERKTGVVVRTRLPACFEKEENVLARLTDALVKAVADLHRVDVEKADLSNLGKPDGYAERQVEGWYKRWNLSKTKESASMDKVYEILRSSIPEPQAISIIHNDLKFDNCQFQPESPDAVTAIFDWDMCTIGDPLFDFGAILCYHPDPMTKMFPSFLPPGDYPSKAEIIEKYGALTGFDMSKIAWYEAFSFWKLAVIVQQLYKRYADGASKDNRMAQMGMMALAFGDIALAKLSKKRETVQLVDKKNMQESFSLKDKVAIITGSSKGIGESMARYLAQAGAKVVISSRNQEAVDAVAASFKANGLEATGIACHVGDEAQLQHLVDQTIEKYGRIDILINNAAINPVYGPIENADIGSFDKIMNINVKAPWLLSNLCLPHMKENGGSIIHISSVEGIHPGFGLGLYSMSKATLIMLTKNQAKEWGKYGIRSNVICPGLVQTKFSEALWTNEKMLGKLERSIPAGRMAQPDEMAGLALLLASGAGSYMTGGVYTADGGYLIAG